MLDIVKLITRDSHCPGPHGEFQVILGDGVRRWLRKQAKQKQSYKDK